MSSHINRTPSQTMNDAATPISERLAQVGQQIANCASSCGRNPQDITLIAVSKTKPVTDIIKAYEAGQRAFGENYLQEAEAKVSALADYHIVWHFIGRILPAEKIVAGIEFGLIGRKWLQVRNTAAGAQ